MDFKGLSKKEMETRNKEVDIVAEAVYEEFKEKIFPLHIQVSVSLDEDNTLEHSIACSLENILDYQVDILGKEIDEWIQNNNSKFNFDATPYNVKENIFCELEAIISNKLFVRLNEPETVKNNQVIIEFSEFDKVGLTSKLPYHYLPVTDSSSLYRK